MKAWFTRFSWIGLFGLCLLGGCRAATPNFKTESRPLDVRDFPVRFSPNEITTRTWDADSGESIKLLRQQEFKLRVPEHLKVMVATFGVAASNRVVCIDFYVAQQMAGGEANYYLLCHDQNSPAYNTEITYAEQDQRSIFKVEGQDQLQGTSKRRWRTYNYELQRKCYLMRGFSEDIGRTTE